ncbi:MAG: dephospho-CoA kinase [Kiritimatiellia bacterium]|jgi:dephospho-CoA kinase
MLSIALTGGIASGKSHFAGLLSKLGADVVDADEVVRSLHRPGGKGAEVVASIFGRSFLLPDGGTNRARLGELVFADADARKRLEQQLHPLVRDHLLAWRDAPSASPIKVAQIPLLFEAGWMDDWDLTVTIEAPLAFRLARLAERGLSREQAMSRIGAQMDSATRTAKADVVIRNTASLEELEAAARIFYHKLESMPR